jgi:arylsulfatase A-like enzyme
VRVRACLWLLLALGGCAEPPSDFLRLADLWLEQQGREAGALRTVPIGGISRMAIPIGIGDEVRIRLVVPRDARLDATLGVGPRDGDAGAARAARLEVAVCGAGQGGRTVVGEARANASAWTPLSLGLGAYAGDDLVLCFSTRAEGGAGPDAGAVLWLANATLGAPDARRWPPAQPNLLLITLDTTRGDHLSSAGYPRETTPHLDRLAADGEQYLNAIVNAPWTLPSHASLFTGLHPREHGARSDPAGDHALVWRFFGLDTAKLTLAEQLWTLGYRTGAVVAGPMVGAEFGFAQGFESYDQPRTGPPAASESAERWSTRRGEEVTDRALAWLGDDVRPFFLFLNYFDPHWPYEPPPDPSPSWVGSDAAPVGRTEHARIWSEVLGDRRDLTEAERRAMVDRYDAEILAMDRAIGRLLEALRARGDYGSTLIAVVSDHGEAFGEHRMLDHGGSLHEHQLRAALLVKYPDGQMQGRTGGRIEHRVDLLDLHSTLLRELGLLAGSELRARRGALPSRLDSYGLHRARTHHFAEVRRNPWFAAAYGARFDRDLEAVYQGRWKLVRDDRGGRWLFDLESDPDEERNLAEREPERSARLAAALDGWARSAAPAPAGGEAVPLSPDLIQRLEDLGYLVQEEAE